MLSSSVALPECGGGFTASRKAYVGFLLWDVSIGFHIAVSNYCRIGKSSGFG
jgi:hypothetical protein